MNQAILRLFVLLVLLFALLVAWTSRWTVFEAEALQDNALNRRTLLEEQRVRRGVIRAADGTGLARSVRNADGTYSRRYPEAGLFAHAVGYSYTRIGQSALERERNDALVGDFGEVETLFDRLGGGTPRGARAARG